MRREPACVGDALVAFSKACPRAAAVSGINSGNDKLGQILSGLDRSVLLFDAMLEGCPIVGASAGFGRLMRRSPAAVLGSSWRPVFLEGLEEVQVARSTCQDVDSFLRMCRLRSIDSMTDLVTTMTTARGDGSACHSRCCWRLVKAPIRHMSCGCQGHGQCSGGICAPSLAPTPCGVFVVLVQAVLGESGDVEGRLPQSCVALPEELALLDELEKKLSGSTCHSAPSSPRTGFSPLPLGAKCILLDAGFGGMRREPHEVPHGCVLMSGQSVPVGLQRRCYAEVTVEGVLSSWSRLPVVGFTCMTPQQVKEDESIPGRCPLASCLGEAITIGGVGEAWMRLAPDCFLPRMGQKTEDGVSYKCRQSGVPPHKRRAGIVLKEKDVLGFEYREQPSPSCGGGCSIGLFVNGSEILSFEFEKTLPDKPVYAVVDVCYSMFKVSWREPRSSAGAPAFGAFESSGCKSSQTRAEAGMAEQAATPRQVLRPPPRVKAAPPPACPVSQQLVECIAGG
eukprot:TRINITY_DN122403_c0_g1_i1.p1 TRINITY_DN122403_c0_g1~~TRINITY_DN122403_c0_g1_i1.p1  ORF type:complete len:508 (+),score=102.12 TRINITY_DN122403_c0_g1_i1:85-1608(+)